MPSRGGQCHLIFGPTYASSRAWLHGCCSLVRLSWLQVVFSYSINAVLQLLLFKQKTNQEIGQNINSTVVFVLNSSLCFLKQGYGALSGIDGSSISWET
jgi:hypothetical protein